MNINCGATKCLLDNAFTDIYGNEQGNTRTKAISFLKQFIQAYNYDAGEAKLNNDKNCISDPSLCISRLMR